MDEDFYPKHIKSHKKVSKSKGRNTKKPHQRHQRRNRDNKYLIKDTCQKCLTVINCDMFCECTFQERELAEYYASFNDCNDSWDYDEIMIGYDTSDYDYSSDDPDEAYEKDMRYHRRYQDQSGCD